MIFKNSHSMMTLLVTRQVKVYLAQFVLLSTIILFSNEITAVPSDTDDDGMPDVWEEQYLLNPFDPNDAELDSDGDSVSNRNEYLFGIDPTNMDSDGDTLPDGIEIDSGLIPSEVDSDADLMDDGWEFYNNLDPLDPNDVALDYDLDSLSNYDEYILGSDPWLIDGDGDLVNDDIEATLGTNPLDADTDNDGLSDNELTDFATDPLLRDSNNNGVIDGFEYGSIIRATQKDPDDFLSDSSGAAISDDGRYIVFVSDSDTLVANDTNQQMDVFWMDILTGERRKISQSWDGSGANNWSGRVVNSIGIDISGDGRYVVFQSGASNIVQNDMNGNSSDIFLNDTQTGETSLVNISNAGVQSNGSSWSPRISANGQFIVFRSSTTSLLSDADNNSYNSDIFIRDRDTQVTELISQNNLGIQGNANSESPSLSDDGRYVSFLSKSSNLVDGDTNNSNYNDLFVRDRQLGTTVRANLDEQGSEIDLAPIYGGDISATGEYLAFSTTASLLVDDTNGSFDCYLHDLATGTNFLISEGNSNIKCITPKISASGRFVSYELLQGTFNTGYGIYVQDLSSGVKNVVSKPNGATASASYSRGSGLAISADGQFVQFALQAILTPDGQSQQDVFVAKSGMPSEQSGPKLTTDVLSTISTDSWTEVSLPYQYESMVIVASPLYESTAVPMVVRIRNAHEDRFEIKLQRVDGNIEAISNISVHYLVVEEGVYTQETHGIKMEAVTFESTVTNAKRSWMAESRNYLNSYTSPVVLGQVLTMNDAAFSTFWSNGGGRTIPPGSDSLFVGKHVAEDTVTLRQNETIGYVVFEEGNGSVNGYEYIAQLGSDTIRGVQNGAKNYLHDPVNNPVSAIACIAGMDGGDGGWAVLMGMPDETTISLAIDEDQLSDVERNHTSEQVAYIVFHTSE